MSLRAMTWATELRGLKAIQFRLLLVLAHHHNHITGQCNPSQDTLAEECEVSLRSVRDHLEALEKMGYIDRSRRVGSEGQCVGTNYTLSLDNTQPANPAGWTEDGVLTPPLPAELSEPNRQLFAGSNEPGIEPFPPLSPREELGYLSPAESQGRPRVAEHPAHSGISARWQGDPKVRQRVVDVAGEAFAKSYIDPATPGPSGEIVARTGIARDKLRSLKALADWRVIGREELPPPRITAKPRAVPSYANARGG